MKKTTCIFITGIIAFIATNVYCKINDLSIPKITNTEQIETQRKEKLDLLQTREYARKSLKSIGRLNVLEGKYQYKNEIKDKGFMDLTVRQMTLDLEYKYSIGIDLQYINVCSVFDRIIVLQIPKDKLELQYIELDAKNSKIINDKKMFLVSNFKPSEVELFLEESQNNVVDKINSDEKLFDKAMDNLKNELEKLCSDFGYQKVLFR